MQWATKDKEKNPNRGEKTFFTYFLPVIFQETDKTGFKCNFHSKCNHMSLDWVNPSLEHSIREGACPA